MLREEDITFDAHKAKKCSFTTSRPLVWARVIEDHVGASTDKKCLKQYKSENGLYIEYLLCYDNDEDKKVTINIYVKTGVILIQGEYFQQWAEKIFPILKASISRYLAPRDMFERRLRSNSFYNTTRRARSKSVGNLTCIGTYKKPECILGYKDMGALWKENVELKKGLESLERDYDNIKRDLDFVHDRGQHCYHVDHGKVRRIVEVSNGKKVSVYTPLNCDDKVEARSKVITESAQKLEKQISDMRGRLQDKIFEIQNTINDQPVLLPCRCDNSHPEITRIQGHIANTQSLILCDIQELKKRIDAIDTTFESLTVFNPNSSTLRRIEEEQKNIQLNVTSIKESLDEMRRKMHCAWVTYPTYAKHKPSLNHKFIP